MIPRLYDEELVLWASSVSLHNIGPRHRAGARNVLLSLSLFVVPGSSEKDFSAPIASVLLDRTGFSSWRAVKGHLNRLEDAGLILIVDIHDYVAEQVNDPKEWIHEISERDENSKTVYELLMAVSKFENSTPKNNT